jgi:glycosyltransferase involved in cell wall biosynthesis
MKVVAIVPLYPPTSRVGAWVASHTLLRGLVEHGHDVIVNPWLVRSGTPHVHEGVVVVPGLRRAELIEHADVVLTHAGSPRVADALDGLTVRVPVVRLVHGLPADPGRLNASAHVIANSQATGAALRPAYRGPLTVVPPPTEPCMYEVERPTGPYVTLVNLSVEKGSRMFWRLAATMPDVPFMGVRGYYGRQNVRRLRNVEVVGPLQDMRAVYAMTRVLLMPSQAETWGMTAIEAMVSGIPVVAQPGLPGLAEALGRAANWPKDKTNSVEAWRTTVHRLMTNQRTYNGASKRALARVAELDFEGSIDRFVAVIEQVAADAR